MGISRRETAFLTIAATLLLLLATACPRKHPPTKPAPLLIKVEWKGLGLVGDDKAFKNLGTACIRSLSYYARLPGDRILDYGGSKVSVNDAVRSLNTFLRTVEDEKLSPEEKMAAIESRFDLFMSTGSDGRGRVLFTGYYEPVLKGRLKPDSVYRFPIYRKPPDLLTVRLRDFPLSSSDKTIYGRVEGDRVVPYFTREQIDRGGKLKGRGLELAWLKDPVDVFFLQVQGSGRLELGNGKIIHVQYDGKNGYPYVSLGKHLVSEGLMKKDEVSMQRIRKFLAERPRLRRDMLNVNPSYTFFRFEKDGPYGNINVALTPYRSIATDSSLFPKGAPCLIRSEKPILDARGNVLEWTPFTRFVMNQDTGGAIRGPGRVDLFCGAGPEAAKTAGAMRNPGRLYFLLEKGIIRCRIQTG